MNPEQTYGRGIFWWLTAAAIVFSCSFYLMTRDNSSFYEPDITGPSTYSRSAIGYAGVFRMLQKLGMETVHLKKSPDATQGDESVLVIAEPPDTAPVLASMRAWTANAAKIVLILPKRHGTPDPGRPGLLVEDELVPDTDIMPVLQLVDPKATLNRPESISVWQLDAGFTEAPTIHTPQLIHSKALRPLIASPEGILVGERQVGTQRLILVSDPDLFANHGLATGHNAAVVYQLMEQLRGEAGQVLFAESIHGFVEHPGHIAGILIQWPFILVTLQIVIAAVLLIWASAGRIGAPARLAPVLGSGKASLIENGARLVLSGGHMPFIAQRYCETIARNVLLRIHGPQLGEMSQLQGWFSATGRPLPAINAVHSPRGAINTAQQIFRWRVTVLNEFRQRSQPR